MKNYYRTIFISDFHLGSRGAQAEALDDFLKTHDAETMYLIGDIIDGWAMKRRSYWNPNHTKVVRRILKRGKDKKRTVYLPGNHDEFLRAYGSFNLDTFAMQDECIHVTADGKSLLILHGDRFDQVVRYHKWIAHAGDIGYSLLLRSNGLVNRIRRWFGYDYFSFSGWVKGRVKSAVAFIGEYERVLGNEVKRRGLHGVVCGHIHHAELRDMDGITYANSGDWVESCTALVEHFDGRLELIRYVPHQQDEPPPDQEPPETVDEKSVDLLVTV